LKPAAALSLLLLGSAACDAERATAPAAAGGLALEVQVTYLDLGLVPRFTFTSRLRNTSDAPLTIVFTGCGVLPYIETWHGEIVHPSGGGWACPGAISSVTLAPGQEIASTDFLVRGSELSYRSNTITIPPGRYRVFATADAYLGTLDGPRLELRSRKVSFAMLD
jgi:hypothetical protein